MSRYQQTDSNNETVQSQTTAAVLSYTKDGDRHRCQFVTFESRDGMWKLTQVERDRTWETLTCERIQRLRIAVGDDAPTHDPEVALDE